MLRSKEDLWRGGRREEGEGANEGFKDNDNFVRVRGGRRAGGASFVGAQGRENATEIE